MTQDFQRLLASPDYDFLRAHERLGNRMMILGLSGSYGYGTNREGSDIDLRGVTMQRASDLLGLTTFEQYTDERTDTVVFGFNKFVQLLLQCNPNCCEILGLPRDSYLILSPLGEKLLEHQSLFFSKRAIQSFGGYASDQLRRLQNALARDSLPQSEREKHILNAAQRALDDFSRRNSRIPEGSIRLYIDQSLSPDRATAIFVDASYQHLPLRDFDSLLDTLGNVVKSYEKLSHRNHKKDVNHLNKHAMHLLRLLMTGTQLLEEHVIVTRREEELPLLMKVRNGSFMEADGTMSRDFYEILDSCERRFQEAAKRTTLPDAPDMEDVGAFVESINRHAILAEG